MKSYRFFLILIQFFLIFLNIMMLSHYFSIRPSNDDFGLFVFCGFPVISGTLVGLWAFGLVVNRKHGIHIVEWFPYLFVAVTDIVLIFWCLYIQFFDYKPSVAPWKSVMALATVVLLVFFTLLRQSSIVTILLCGLIIPVVLSLVAIELIFSLYFLNYGPGYARIGIWIVSSFSFVTAIFQIVVISSALTFKNEKTEKIL